MPVSEVKKQGPYFGVGGMAIPFWGWALAINIVSTHILLISIKVLKADGCKTSSERYFN